MKHWKEAFCHAVACLHAQCFIIRVDVVIPMGLWRNVMVYINQWYGHLYTFVCHPAEWSQVCRGTGSQTGSDCCSGCGSGSESTAGNSLRCSLNMESALDTDIQDKITLLEDKYNQCCLQSSEIIWSVQNRLEGYSWLFSRGKWLRPLDKNALEKWASGNTVDPTVRK